MFGGLSSAAAPPPDQTPEPDLKPARPPKRRMTRKQARRLRVRTGFNSKATATMVRIVEAVAEMRGVRWRALFEPGRGTNAVSSARVLAMAACGASDVTLAQISRAFSRDWATIYSAERRCSRLYRNSAEFRKEWDAIVSKPTVTERIPSRI